MGIGGITNPSCDKTLTIFPISCKPDYILRNSFLYRYHTCRGTNISRTSGSLESPVTVTSNP